VKYHLMILLQRKAAKFCVESAGTYDGYESSSFDYLVSKSNFPYFRFCWASHCLHNCTCSGVDSG
jgi:hypothetical protein